MKLLKTLLQPLKATISAFAVVWSCQAAENLDYWQGVGGVYDGSYTNEQHWSQGFVADIGSRAYIG